MRRVIVNPSFLAAMASTSFTTDWCDPITRAGSAHSQKRTAGRRAPSMTRCSRTSSKAMCVWAECGEYPMRSHSRSARRSSLIYCQYSGSDAAANSVDALRMQPARIGGLIALANLSVVFVVAAIVTGLAAVPIATVPNVRLARGAEAPVGALRIARRLLPLIIFGVGTSYMIGTFDTIWSLYMTYRGATTLAVGISFATFGIPGLLVSARAGALGDRFGAQKLIVGSLFVTAFFSSIYPFIASVPWLIGLGLIEGAFTISGAPSLIAEVSRNAHPGCQGRTQGVFQAAQSSIQIAGALAGGYLFTIGPAYAFLAITAFCVFGAASGTWLSSARRRAAAIRTKPLRES